MVTEELFEEEPNGDAATVSGAEATQELTDDRRLSSDERTEVTDQDPEAVAAGQIKLPAAQSQVDDHTPGRGSRSLPEGSYRPGRRVVRILRNIQLWSVFKIALIASVVFYAIFMGAIAVLWSLAMSTGQVHHVEKFMRDIGFVEWTFDGPVLFTAALGIGAVGVILTTVMFTLGAAIINLVSEFIGGVRLTVIEEVGSDQDD